MKIWVGELLFPLQKEVVSGIGATLGLAKGSGLTVCGLRLSSGLEHVLMRVLCVQWSVAGAVTSSEAILRGIWLAVVNQ